MLTLFWPVFKALPVSIVALKPDCCAVVLVFTVSAFACASILAYAVN